MKYEATKMVNTQIINKDREAKTQIINKRSKNRQINEKVKKQINKNTTQQRPGILGKDRQAGCVWLSAGVKGNMKAACRCHYLVYV